MLFGVALSSTIFAICASYSLVPMYFQDYMLKLGAANCVLTILFMAILYATLKALLSGKTEKQRLYAVLQILLTAGMIFIATLSAIQLIGPVAPKGAKIGILLSIFWSSGLPALAVAYFFGPTMPEIKKIAPQAVLAQFLMLIFWWSTTQLQLACGFYVLILLIISVIAIKSYSTGHKHITPA